MRVHHSILVLASALSAQAFAGATGTPGPAGPASGSSAVIERPTQAASALPDGPLGYSPQHMDRGASPRQDFYRYAAGHWLDRLTIPAAESEVSGFSLLRASLDQRLLALVQAASQQGGPKGSPQQLVGDHFRAAMDVQRLDALGLQPIQADLDEAGRARSPAELARLSVRLQMGNQVSPLLNLLAMTDLKDSTRTRLVLYPGGPQLEQSQYTEPASQRIRDLYVDYISRAHRQLGDTPEAAAAKARLILAIETELMAPRLKPLESRDPARIYNLATPDEAQAMIPAIDLKALLAEAGIAAPAQVQIIDVAAPQGLNRLLQTRPADELRTFLRWSVLSASADQLGQPWRGLSQDFQRQRDGLAASLPRDRETVQAISVQLFSPLSQLYVQAHFSDAMRQDIATMVGHIKQEFAIRLRSNPWLDGPTRAAALNKLARVDIQVGYPRQWIDNSSLDIRADDFVGNNRRIAAFNFRRELAKVGVPVVAERFADARYTSPIAVNAGYNPSMNSIDITAAIAQPPFYQPGGDIAVNYCTMGAVIGHELTHGFDSNGRQYDATGNVRDWWTPRAAADFAQRTDALARQVSRVELLPGLKQDGTLTLGENTADLGGITLAHAALQRALKGRTLPKVDGMTADQRCFVAWSQLWIYKAREERIRLLAATDYHAIGFVRATQPLLNLDAFHQAFGTRPGDAMWRAPAQRVRIW
ncbi:M13 family metallopeptidase [Ideonella sp. DXS22W]|uniref:M13 family metallopeptidase n=1 Tax=Pseudaquabacterium inlustre TaxID=2984192 RepID=A0ABU9CIM0_9BURK